ncbi:GAF domain-containing protein [Parapusillimonas sp. SGNA-6]|nr:GAF domain-containing protein [Parapusillimonas sp. SGNA-6]
MTDTSNSTSGPLAAGLSSQFLDALKDAYAAGDATAIFASLDRATRPFIGQTLCTANRYEPSEEKLFRLYSSNATAYSPGGSKSKGGTPWGEHVLHQRKVFVGEGAGALQEVFDDAETILALGLRSVINVPVVFQDVCLGTFNVLMLQDKVNAPQVEWARLAGLLSIPAFQAVRAAGAM